jgi:hypothetical protein
MTFKVIDGMLYELRDKKWVKTILSPEILNFKTKPIKDQKNTILIGEFYKGKNSKLLKLPVDDEFKKKLTKAKHKVSNQNGIISSAYVFGKEYQTGYLLISKSYRSEIGQTVLADITNMPNKEIKDLYSKQTMSKWAAIYLSGIKKQEDIQWDNKSLLKITKKVISANIYFICNHINSSSSVLFYIHLDDKQSIDSLIIDYGYFSS